MFTRTHEHQKHHLTVLVFLLYERTVDVYEQIRVQKLASFATKEGCTIYLNFYGTSISLPSSVIVVHSQVLKSLLKPKQV